MFLIKLFKKHLIYTKQ